MILVDTSAWVEYLRGTGSPACERLTMLLGEPAPAVAVCAPVRLEVLAGAKDAGHLVGLRRLLARVHNLETTPAHHDQAAALYRTCRRGGGTVRKLMDCLIAAVAIDHQALLLHADADFAVLARQTALRVDYF